MKKINSLYRGKRALVIPRMESLSPKDTNNLFTWTLYKFVEFLDRKEIGLKSLTINDDSLGSIDVAFSRFCGADILQDESIYGKLRKNNIPIFEYNWCPLNSMFMLERVTIGNNIEEVLEKESENIYKEKSSILGYSLV